MVYDRRDVNLIEVLLRRLLTCLTAHPNTQLKCSLLCYLAKAEYCTAELWEKQRKNTKIGNIQEGLVYDSGTWKEDLNALSKIPQC